MAKRKELTPISSSWMRKEKFAREFVLTCSVAKAYKKAYNYNGTDKYAKQKGDKLLKNKTIQEMIEIERGELLSNDRIKQKFVLDTLLEVVKDSKDDKDRNNLLKALDMVNKMSGAYNHRQEVDVNGMAFQFNFIKNDSDEDGNGD